MPLSTAYRTKVVDAILRNTSFTPPATVYIGLFTADPTKDYIAANEVQYGAVTWYARQTAAFDAQSPAGVTSNSATITFPTVTGADVTATHYALFDSATAGVMLSYGALSAPTKYSAGDVPSVLSGQLVVTLT